MKAQERYGRRIRELAPMAAMSDDDALEYSRELARRWEAEEAEEATAAAREEKEAQAEVRRNRREQPRIVTPESSAAWLRQLARHMAAAQLAIPPDSGTTYGSDQPNGGPDRARKG